jgi:ABC-type Fe3+ transport system permease subunit
MDAITSFKLVASMLLCALLICCIVLYARSRNMKQTHHHDRKHDHNHAHERAYVKNGKRGIFQVITAIPWCCVITVPLLVLSLFTTAIPIAAIGAFDEFFHGYLLWPLVALHIFGLVSYFGYAKHKTKNTTMLYIASSVLFAITLAFHFTPLHDMLYHHDEAGSVHTGQTH